MFQDREFTVTEILSKIKRDLEGNYQTISVQGEVSNLSRAHSGHWYFTLKDQNACLKSVVFRVDAFRNPIMTKLKEGDLVTCYGDLGVYPKGGTFQLITKRIVYKSKGDLKEQFEELKRKLSAEGLFDIAIKKEIPKFPKRVGLITALSGATIQDFIDIFNRRSSAGTIVVCPALMQGDKAHLSVIDAISKLEKQNVDVIVLCRGGGSLEDLWCFNHEELARKIFDVQVPIVSAIGHQTDYTISDYVADLRAETPSAAAELLSKGFMELQEHLVNLVKRMDAGMKSRLSETLLKLEGHSPQALTGELWKRIKCCWDGLNDLSRILDPDKILNLNERHMALDDISSRMQNALENLIQVKGRKIEELGRVLEVLCPQNILERGYCFLTDENQSIIDSKDSVIQRGREPLNINLKDGSVKVVYES